MSALPQSPVWDELLHSVESSVNRETFDTWFRPIQFDGLDNSARTLHLRAPNSVIRDWVVSNYSSLLDRSLGAVHLAGYSMVWTVQDRDSRSSTEPSRNPCVAEATAETDSNRSTVNDSSLTRQKLKPADPLLNARYTFESFVVGSCNQFAHAASMAVAEAPGRTYNPLYLYGGVGLGKTHLMHACGHAIKARNHHLRLCYISSEKFMNDLINAIRYDKTQSFREKYRSVDVLLIDDVQFMAGKERTQEEFFHTFNALYDQQKQIVISSDCPPREIPTLEERLHSRFEWGLIADIEPPDLETKVAILRRKAELQQFDLPDDVALYLANNSKHNIRELEGSLIRVLAMSSLRGLPLSKALVEDALRGISRRDDENFVSISRIQKTVADHYKVSADILRTRSNARHILVPRQIAMYLCKRLTKKSYPEIARQFGGKHHTTVMHSVEKIDRLISSDVELNRTVQRLTETLNN